MKYLPITLNHLQFPLSRCYSSRGASLVSQGKESSCNSGDLGLMPREDPLEKETVTHSSIHAWETPWTAWQGTVHGFANS